MILFFGGADYANRKDRQGLGAVQVGMDTVEALRRQWACEVGPHGVRVVSLLTGGITETVPDMPEVEPHKQSIIDGTLLGRAATSTTSARSLPSSLPPALGR